jgi:hypothetical protein
MTSFIRAALFESCCFPFSPKVYLRWEARDESGHRRIVRFDPRKKPVR